MQVIKWSGGVKVNADGAAHCYHPADWGPRSEWRPVGRAPLGLDAPESGGRRIYGPDDEVVAYRGWGFKVVDGQPVLRPDGYYESATALHPTFDAEHLPGWTLPRGFAAELGDLALVEYKGLRIWAICCDIGNQHMELSPYACERIGIPHDARTGGVEEGVSLTVFAGSRTRMPGTLTADLIQDLGEKLWTSSPP